jgi:plasmid stabilization system protein ParE
MPKSVVWSKLAEKDFENILDYLNNNWSNLVAINFIDITENLVSQISNNPKQFPVWYKKKKVRKCVMTKHNSLFYRDGKLNIEILRIYDTRQDPITLKFI